ncbi:hypothetical protein SAMN04487910_1918 [Aquimarina amphilecti]|uniref:Uncharacterized protein n=1 Tax=Aquimarina amphilecti TaxID=1038014 RepID=A0A1H7N1F2_AQUAM|nr:hypothetical protein [Aquimarina amphilecti]SEL16838.1 hypothetical protein SAMN04487910_1918 [Aquimarina amphilecti]
MKKILVKENIILDKELFDSFYADAKKKGLLVISNEKGRAEMSTGIFMLNGIPDMSKDDYYIKRVLFGLIQKYGRFHFTSKRFQEKMLLYEYEVETKTWSSYNQSE